MTFDDYQVAALRTGAEVDPANLLTLATMGLGIAGEAGEVADTIKKVIGHGHDLDKKKLALEISDVLWY